MPSSEEKKPLSEVLMDAALRIDEMPPELLSQLLMKAAIRLRVIQEARDELVRRVARDERRLAVRVVIDVDRHA